MSFIIYVHVHLVGLLSATYDKLPEGSEMGSSYHGVLPRWRNVLLAIGIGGCKYSAARMITLLHVILLPYTQVSLSGA